MNILRHTFLNDTDSEKLGGALSRAFDEEPNFKYIIPDEDRRKEVLAWFFGTFTARLGLMYGEVYTTENYSGSAIWMKPAHKVGLWGAVKSGLLKMPFHFKLHEMQRSIRLSIFIEKIREEYAPEDHWYLMALGVDPDTQSIGVGSALLQPVLARADREATDCYLETFSLRSRKFYQKFGFEVKEEHQVPKGGPEFWSMIREWNNS